MPLDVKTEKRSNIIIGISIAPELFQLNEELAKVDKLLDDKRFFAPFRKKFSNRLGRPSVPVETYLRMIYLKRRYQLGYETMVKEVRGSFAWRRFCHLSQEDPVPDDTTLIKMTKNYGEGTLLALNDAIVLKLKGGKVIRSKKLRLNTANSLIAHIHDNIFRCRLTLPSGPGGDGCPQILQPGGFFTSFVCTARPSLSFSNWRTPLTVSPSIDGL